MTLPDLSALGLETSAEQRTLWQSQATETWEPWQARYAMLARDFSRLITALSEARGREAELVRHKEWAAGQYTALQARSVSALIAREAAARETIATLTAENAELTRRAADAYRLARQPAPEPVDGGGNDADRSRHFPMKD